MCGWIALGPKLYSYCTTIAATYIFVDVLIKRIHHHPEGGGNQNHFEIMVTDHFPSRALAQWNIFICICYHPKTFRIETKTLEL